MHRTMFPGYTVGADAYDDIAGVCGQYGRKAVIIGGEKALAAAKDKILRAIEGSNIEITGVLLVRRRGVARERRDAAPEGGGRGHDLRRRRRQGHRHLQGARARHEAALLHLPDDSLDLRGLHEPRHRVSSRRKPPRILVLENPAEPHLHRHGDQSRTRPSNTSGPEWATRWRSITNAPYPRAATHRSTPTRWA